MKRTTLLLLIMVATISGFSQTQEIDSLKEAVDNHQGKLNALDERVLVNEADLAKLNKIRISGYVQAQFETFQRGLVTANGPVNTFQIRRARLKVVYEPLDGIKFVLQPDFSTGNIALKDAYAVVNIPRLKNWSLWAGQFNRPDYEVEYSSSQREVMERSRVIRAIYPGEREIGVKLEYTGLSVPLKGQLMLMNGNFTGSQAIDFDTKKDLMGRLVYSIKMPKDGIGIDLGLSGYYGGSQVKTNKYISLNPLAIDSVAIGSYLDKKWIGAEMQIYADILGGLAVKGEYISGKNNYVSSVTANALISLKQGDPNKVRDFSGYYVYFIKNIGKKNQFVARYDYYDPNTKVSGDEAKNELYYKTLAIAWQYYLNDNIRITVQYTIPKNETNTANPVDIKDNVFGIRVQTKF